MLYRKYEDGKLNWIYSGDAAGFMGNSGEIPHLGMIQMLEAEILIYMVSYTLACQIRELPVN